MNFKNYSKSKLCINFYVKLLTEKYKSMNNVYYNYIILDKKI